MRSAVPKILQPICGRPMVGLVADSLRGAGLDEVVAVVSQGDSSVVEAIGGCVSAPICGKPSRMLNWPANR